MGGRSEIGGEEDEQTGALKVLLKVILVMGHGGRRGRVKTPRRHLGLRIALTAAAAFFYKEGKRIGQECKI